MGAVGARPQVTVVGAGIVGLTTALELLRHGCDVRVLADRLGERCTSGVAGAVWYPYGVGSTPDPRTYGWARETYTRLVEIAHANPDCGIVASLPLYLLSGDRPAGGEPEWFDAVPERGVEWVETAALPALVRRCAIDREGTAGSWRFIAPIVDPALHLAWLRRQLADRVEIVPAVADLGAVPGDFVINCTGRRARTLAGDDRLQPVFGQAVVTRDPRIPRSFAFADDRDRDELIYLVPRGGEVVLGGCDIAPEPGDPAPWTSAGGPPPRPELSERILSRFEKLGLARPTEFEARAEWRPSHALHVVVRREGRIVHNYGHGGAGYTLAYGCARSVLEMLRTS